MSNRNIHSTGIIEQHPFDYDNCVKKYIYDRISEERWEKAQLISDNYFTPMRYPHSITIRYRVTTYSWDHLSVTDSRLWCEHDLTEKVVSVSYDLDGTNNIRQTANLTLLVPPNDDFWYMNREYDIRKVPSGSALYNVYWLPVIYKIEQIFTFKNDKPVYRGIKNSNWFDSGTEETLPNTEYTRNLGFFLPESNSYSYDSTTSELSMSLQGLSAAFTEQHCGSIVTPIASNDYYIDYDYNNGPTSIKRYQEKTTNSTSTTGTTTSTTSTTSTTTSDTKTVQSAAEKTEVEKAREAVTQAEYNVYNNLPEVVRQYGVLSGTIVPLNHDDDEQTYNYPIPLAVSGFEDASYGELGDTPIWWSGPRMTEFLYRICSCQHDSILNRYRMPMVGFIAPRQVETELSSFGQLFVNGWEFENGTTQMEICEKMLESKYHEAYVFVDENRYFNLQVPPTVLSYDNDHGFIPYRAYSDLIISEDVEVDESSFYTCTQVFGKDGMYYASFDTSDAFKVGYDIGGDPSNWWEQFRNSVGQLSMIPKVQVIQDDSLESNDECFDRAYYETYKSTRGHTTISVKLRDNYIYATGAMSQLVNATFVEYRMRQGSNGNGQKTFICLLTKASMSDDGTWSWTLQPFYSYSPNYDMLNVETYQRFTSSVETGSGTKVVDEYLDVKYKADWLTESGTPVSSQKKNTLHTPAIFAYEVVQNKYLRLYISSPDIGFSVAKVWVAKDSGAWNTGWFAGETVNTDGTGDLEYGSDPAESVADILDGEHIYKIFDYPISENGTYTFVAQLYSPYHECSVSSQETTITVTELIVEDESGTHKPYLTNEFSEVLSTENVEWLTI